MPGMVWKPDVTVAAIAERDGQFLLVEERVGGRLVLNQPAGHLEDGETFLDAVVRETFEESGWRFRPDAVVGIYVWRPDPSARTFLRVAFSGVLDGCETPRPPDRAIVRLRWLSHPELADPALRLRSPLVRRAVEDYLAGIRYPCSLISHLDPTAPLTTLAASG
jgi:8-oxo-dGTP pyrophosphatase MutT (NUDIX family)